MPWESKRQQRWGHGKGGKKAGFTPEKIKEWDEKTDFESLPEEAASCDQSVSTPLTPIDETYRNTKFPLAEILNWDIPAEGRPCGEGEDPKRGKCNPNLPLDRSGEKPDPYGPIPLRDEKPGRYDIGPEEYRQDPGEWEREIERQSGTPYSKDPIQHPNDVGIDPAFRGGLGPMTAPQIDDLSELSDSIDQDAGGEYSTERLVDTAKRMGLHDERSDALLRQWRQENPGVDEHNEHMTMELMHDHYEKKIMKPGYEGAGTPVKDTPGFPPTKDRHLPAYRPNKKAPEGASMSQIESKLDWSTHKSETFDDTGEKGLHPAWGLKSIIDRGLKPHEKPGADKRIGKGEHQIQKRDIDSKSFKSYSMVNAFDWSN